MNKIKCFVLLAFLLLTTILVSQTNNSDMEESINNFYEAFANKDAETMVSYYHDSIVFSDPAFGQLKGERAKNMWRMLCESQKDKDFVVSYSNVSAAKDSGRAKWEAKYNFSATNRDVHNKISANFKFKDGKIIEHIDDFNLHKWSIQALGFKGRLFGGMGFFKKKLQQTTNGLLDDYEEKNK